MIFGKDRLGGGGSCWLADFRSAPVPVGQQRDGHRGGSTSTFDRGRASGGVRNARSDELQKSNPAARDKNR
jgi:hypothetical protein